jgi:hypothetical protein
VKRFCIVLRTNCLRLNLHVEGQKKRSPPTQRRRGGPASPLDILENFSSVILEESQTHSCCDFRNVFVLNLFNFYAFIVIFIGSGRKFMIFEVVRYTSIIGMDFSAHYVILVNTKNKRLRWDDEINEPRAIGRQKCNIKN